MTDPAEKTLYDVLEVSSKASPETIRAAYKSLLQRYHPDKHPDDPGLAALAKEMVGAYQVLSDPQARADYDRRLSDARRKHQAQADAPRAGPAAPTPPPPPAAPAAPARGNGMLRPVVLGAGALLLAALAMLWTQQSGRVDRPADSPGGAAEIPADDSPPIPAPEPAAPAPEAAAVAQRMKDWLLAYRRLDPSVRSKEVDRLVANGTLPVVQAYGRFFSDPAELRQSAPGLVQPPNGLGLEEAAALDDLQSWWLGPGQLNVMILNNLRPIRPIVGFIFELVAGNCISGQPIGAVAVDLGADTVEPEQAALLRITLSGMPKSAVVSDMCGTIASAHYGSPRSPSMPRAVSAEDQEYDALLAQAELAHPELDPKAHQFRQANTNWVVKRVELYVKQGKSRPEALRTALAEYEAAVR